MDLIVFRKTLVLGLVILLAGITFIPSGAGSLNIKERSLSGTLKLFVASPKDVYHVGEDVDLTNGFPYTIEFTASADDGCVGFDSGIYYDPPPIWWPFARGYHTGNFISELTDIGSGIKGYCVNVVSYVDHWIFGDYVQLSRISIPFNTESLPETATFTSVALILQKFNPGAQNTHPDSNDFITVVPVTLANPPVLTIEDYDQFDSLDNPTELSERFDVSEQWDTSDEIIFDLNDNGFMNIDKMDFSIFGLRTGYDLFEEIPNDEDDTKLKVNFISGDSPSGKPRLSIQYDLKKSQIINREKTDLNGFLTMKVQKYINDHWDDVDIIVENIGQTIPCFNTVFSTSNKIKGLALDEIWNPIGWTATQPGQYRVNVEFKTRNNLKPISITQSTHWKIWAANCEFSVIS